jgi:hypothetical protein
VAGQAVDLREDHRPGHVGDAADEFAVDEVAHPPGGQAEGHQRGDEVGDGQPGALGARPNSHMATSTPRKPPWKAMPPCHTARISAGWAR